MSRPALQTGAARRLHLQQKLEEAGDLQEYFERYLERTAGICIVHVEVLW